MRLDHLLSKEEGVEEGKGILFNYECSERRNRKKYLVAMRFRETPVPIPNTTVKTRTAESTVLETIWEGRWLPE